MTKEIETWIEENNPYNEPNPELIWNAKFFAWQEGAKAMYALIEEIINTELNDMFIQLCVDYNIPDEVADKYISTFKKHWNDE